MHLETHNNDYVSLDDADLNLIADIIDGKALPQGPRLRLPARPRQEEDYSGKVTKYWMQTVSLRFYTYVQYSQL
jgi:hypothetical protein